WRMLSLFLDILNMEQVCVSIEFSGDQSGISFTYIQYIRANRDCCCAHSYSKMVSLIQWCFNKMERHHTLLLLYA
ncbi:hypothetical protein L9F63_016943, partial [Diploptera punctata]